MKKQSGDLASDPLKFAALMAHQIQSPLSTVSSVLHTVLAEYAGPLPAQQRSAIEKASARCDQAITSVRRMLTIIRAEVDRETPVIPASLSAVIRDVHSHFAAEAAAHGMQLTFESKEEGIYARLGEAALFEVLSVLLNNALKYTPDHGRVRIRAGPVDGQVQIAVADSGIGVREEDRQRIFEPFFRTPAVRKSSRPGVGLGLAFVKSIVTASGGTVSVGKADLGGAEFTLSLPQAEPAETAAEERRSASAFRVVVIGGVTAGPKAAAKIIRLKPDADVTVVEKGSILSYAGCGLPYYVAGVVKDQRRLISSPAGVVRDPVFFRSVKNVHVMNETEALEIDKAGRRVRVRDRATGRESWLPYHKLVLATGAVPVVPPGFNMSLENVFTLHGVRDAEGIRTALAGSRARDVVVVGGGLIGVEITDALVVKGARVTIVEKLPHILPMVDADVAAMVERHMEARGVRIVTETAVVGFEGDRVVKFVVTDKGRYPADLVIVAAGVRPEVTLASRCGLDLGETGAIAVDAYMRTSDPDIFAAGDCAETQHVVTGRPYYFPLGSTASKHGRAAAVNLCGGRDAFAGILGTCICKVFDYAVARTGLGEAEARSAGYEVVTAHAPGPDRAHFMPGAALLMLKLIVDAKSRQLLGAQAAGSAGVDKRIDVAALAIRARMTVDEMANADLGYAPSFSPAMDNLITAANVARNKLDGYVSGVSPSVVWKMLKEKESFLFLDVRTPEEFERVRLPGSANIPLGALRERLPELSHDSLIVTFCDISLRGYEAALILRTAGYERVKVMDGGMAMWPYETLE